MTRRLVSKFLSVGIQRGAASAAKSRVPAGTGVFDDVVVYEAGIGSRGSVAEEFTLGDFRIPLAKLARRFLAAVSGTEAGTNGRILQSGVHDRSGEGLPGIEPNNRSDHGRVSSA